MQQMTGMPAQQPQAHTAKILSTPGQNLLGAPGNHQ